MVACYEQQGNTIALWAMDNTDRRLIPGVIQLADRCDLVPVRQFVHDFRLHAASGRALDTPGKEKPRTRTLTKMSMAAFFKACLSDPCLRCLVHGRSPSELVVVDALFVFVTLGEPLSLSHLAFALLQGCAAPDRVADDGGEFRPQFPGRRPFARLLGTYWTTMSKPAFFVMIAAVSGLAGLIIWAMERPLRPLLQEKS